MKIIYKKENFIYSSCKKIIINGIISKKKKSSEKLEKNDRKKDVPSKY